MALVGEGECRLSGWGTGSILVEAREALQAIMASTARAEECVGGRAGGGESRSRKEKSGNRTKQGSESSFSGAVRVECVMMLVAIRGSRGGRSP